MNEPSAPDAATPSRTATAADVSLIEPPPSTLFGILRRLGPGLIIAGSIVGSGELIATTKTGAEAGFSLLWLILIGCVIKVFVQVEFGRYSIVSGETTMLGMKRVFGPLLEFRLWSNPGSPRLVGNWLTWYWLFMFLASLAQLGGIVGGVGQALAISAPLTETGEKFNAISQADSRVLVLEAERAQVIKAGSDTERLAALELALSEARESRSAMGEKPEKSKVWDDRLWAAIVTVITAVVLVLGRYGLIQSFSTAMVAGFTLITIANLFLLQSYDTWAVSWSDIQHGFSFSLPPMAEGAKISPLGTALAAFGIIGVGATELISYPYWCLEKGYARFTGPRENTEKWAQRARGWMRVMQWDCWCSMVVYTFATIAFYLLGAAVLWRTGLNPADADLISTLSVMYLPVFGAWAPTLFLFGAFAVLYSTFFVATAGHARVSADALRVFAGWEGDTRNEADERWFRRATTIFSGVFPFLSLTVYLFIQAPAQLVLLSGVMQAIMLPMLSAAAIYFRYYCCDARLRPGRIWDAFLWLSAFGMLLAGGWLALTKLIPSLQTI